MATATAPAVRPHSQAKVVFFIAFFALTLFAVYYKNARVFDPTSPIAQHFAPVKWYIAVHGSCAAIATLVAAFQFSDRLRARYLGMHRVLGYLYVTSVFIACPFAVLISAKIALSITQFALDCTLSIAWATTTLIALYCVRSGNVVQHRRWMIRSYPWAMTFTFNRIISVLLPSTRFGHSGFEAKIWLSAVLAAFLPTIVLEWRAIFSRSTARLGAMPE